jgi:hypothetical protein
MHTDRGTGTFNEMSMLLDCKEVLFSDRLLQGSGVVGQVFNKLSEHLVDHFLVAFTQPDQVINID